MIPWLEADDPFPDVSQALSQDSEAPGLLAASADFWPERILNAYKQGIFPWFSDGQPVLWWFTDPRMVLPTGNLAVSRSLQKKIRQVEKSMATDQRWEIRFDGDFKAVIQNCAAPRKSDSGTWITEEIINNYVKLHEMGYAHSSELWFEGELVGGLYGISIGKMFFGESMFSKTSDASKIALVWMAHFLHSNGVSLIDCQQKTPHLASLGGKTVSKDEFSRHLLETVNQPPITNWIPIPLPRHNRLQNRSY